MKAIHLLVAFLLLTEGVFAAQYRSIANGNFSDPAIWESSTDGINWLPAAVAPMNGSHSCTIQAGHTVVLNQDLILNDQVANTAPFFSVAGTLVFDHHFIQGESGSNGSVFTLLQGATLEIKNASGLRKDTLGALRNFATYSLHPLANYIFSGTTNQEMNLGIDSSVNNLTMLSSATVTSTEPIIVYGTVQVNAGIFHLNQSLTLKGNALSISGGSITSGSRAELHFKNAASGQSIPASISTLNKLSIHTTSGAGIQLNSPLTVTAFAGFKLLNGKLNTGPHYLYLKSDDPVVGNASSYVIGELKMDVETFSETHNEKIIFPIGGNAFQPIGFTVSTPSNAGPVVLSARVFESKPSGSADKVSLGDSLYNRYWQIKTESVLNLFDIDQIEISPNGISPALSAQSKVGISTNNTAASFTGISSTINSSTISSTLPLSGSLVNELLTADGLFIGIGNGPLAGGTYCIGPSAAYLPPSGTTYLNANAPYPTLTAAFAALTLYGNSGPVTFELQQDYVSTAEASPISIQYKATADRAIRIQVRPDLTTPLLIEKAVNSGIGVISFVGARHVTIDGRIGNNACHSGYGLIVRNTMAPVVNQNFGVGRTCISLHNDAKQIEIKGLQLEIPDNGISFDNTLGTQGCDSITIACNKFMPRNDLLNTNCFVYGVRFSHYGTTPPVNSNNILIDNNYFDNCAVSVWTLYGMDGLLTVTNNHVYRSVNNNPGPSFNAFMTFNHSVASAKQYMITGNYFGGTQAFCGGAKMNIRGVSNNLMILENLLSTTTKSVFSGNHFENFESNLSNGIKMVYIPGGVWDIIGNNFGNPLVTTDIQSASASSWTCLEFMSNSNATTNSLSNRIIGNSFNNLSLGNAGGTDFYGIYYSGNVQSVIDSNRFNHIHSSFLTRFFLVQSSVLNVLNNQTNYFRRNIAEDIQQNSGTMYDAALFSILNSGGSSNWEIVGNRIGALNTPNSIVLNAPNIIPFRVTLQSGISRLDSNSVAQVSLTSSNNTTSQVVMDIEATYLSSCAYNQIHTITSQAKPYEAETGIYYGGSLTGMRFQIGGSTNMSEIHHNRIEGLHATNTNPQTNSIGVIGMLYRGANSSSPRNRIYSNEIYNLTNQAISSGNTPYIQGIHFYTGHASLYNNRIALSNASYSNVVNITGIYKIVNNIPFSCYHNSISITGTSTAGSKSFAFKKGGGSGTDTVKNNIFLNTRNGAGLNYAIGNLSPAPSNWGICNYNDVYAINSATTIESLSGVSSTLASWQTVYGKDVNSKNIPVNFIDSSADLHVSTASNCGVNGAGTPVGTVTQDMDGQQRNTSAPDLGADEFDGEIELEAGTEKFICRDSLSLNATQQAGTTGFWSGNGVTFTPSNTDPNATVHGLVTGLNTLVWHVSNAYCSRTDTLRINYSNVSGPLTTNYNNAICPGATVNLALSSPLLNGAWSTGDTTQMITIQPLSTQTITVTGTDIYSCPVNDTVTISVIPSGAILAAQPLLPFNLNEEVQLPVTFNWTLGQGILSRELFVWKQNETRPANGTSVSTSTQLTMPGLQDQTSYFWQILSTALCDTLWSDTFAFKVNHPDLSLESISCSNTLTSFSPNTISWVVKNVALGSSTKNYYWFDQLSMSPDTVYGNFNDTYLGDFSYLYALTGGLQYTQQKTIHFPELATGSYRLYARAGNLMGLDLNPMNNLFYKDVQVLHKPTADLKVVSLGSPADAFAGDSILIAYTVENDGVIATDSKRWNDEVYISPLPFFNSSAIKLAETGSPNFTLDTNYFYTQNGPVISSVETIPYPIQVDSFYTVNKKFRVPTNLLSGQYYIYVKVNSNHPFGLYEGAYVNNNLAKSPIVLSLTQLPPADLVVDSFSCPTVIGSGTTVSVSWRVKNQGIAETAVSQWKDRVYINTSNGVYGAIVLTTTGRKTSLLKDSSYLVTTQVKIPHGISGAYYMLVRTDDSNDVFEYLQENNNTYSTPNPITINLSPYPDLQIANVHFDFDTLQSNIPVNLSFTIKNTGTAASSGSFRQALYRIDPSIDPDSLIYIGDVSHALPILPGDSVIKTTTLYTPGKNGYFYFKVKADHTNTQYEHTEEGNNLSFADTVFIRAFTSDLAIHNATFPSSTTSGQTYFVSYAVENDGSGTTSQASHTNRVFVSTDSTYSIYDLPVSSIQYYGLLDSTQGYTHTLQINLPHSLSSGNYYLLVLVDGYNDITNDANTANNTVAIPFTNTQIPAPDLLVIDIQYPDTINKGQAFYVSYTVQNNGPGNMTNVNVSDVLFINSGPGINNYYGLGIQQKIRDLLPNQSYTDSILVPAIPGTYSGFQYFTIQSDPYNTVYENGVDNNNMLADYVFVQTTSNMDLVPTYLHLPKDTFLLGEEVSVPFAYTNAGSNVYLASTRNAMYLENTSLAEMTELNFKSKYISIAPGDTLQDTLVVKIKDITPFWVNAQLKLNTSLSFPESNLNNNILTKDSVYVDATELLAEVPLVQTLPYNTPRYYKIFLPANQDLAIFVKHLSGSGQNEVSCSYQKVPGSSTFEFNSNDASSKDQIVLVPETQNGWYYIYVQNNQAGATNQQIEITAKILPPSILSVNQNEVGQGTVTTAVLGSGFRPYSKIFLASGGSIVSSGTIVKLYHTMKLDVLWHLDSVATGVYDVLLVNNTDTFSLPQGLTVELSTGYSVAVNTRRLGSFLATRRGGYETTVSNIGNVDIPVVYHLSAGLKERTFTTFTPAESILGIEEDTSQNYVLPGAPVGRKFDGFVFDMRPGEARSTGLEEHFTQATCSPDRGCPLIQRVYKSRTMTMSHKQFSKSIIYYAEQQRQEFMTVVHEDFPSWAGSAPDKKLFYQITLQKFVDQGLLDTNDFENYILTEKERYIDFDPGEIIGLQTEHQVAFNSGDVYRWDINVPTVELGAVAGTSIGWDLLKSTGDITINATSNMPFEIIIVPHNPCNKDYTTLTTWEPWHDYKWPLAVAEGSITGFQADKFFVNSSYIDKTNNLYGGHFEVSLSQDTLYLEFKHRVRNAGEPGYHGGPGLCGYPGGNGESNVMDARGGDGGRSWTTDAAGGQGGSGILGGGSGGEGFPKGANGLDLNPDNDNDGVPDTVDVCPNFYNPAQLDTDGDGFGDDCDPYPLLFNADSDQDRIPDTLDNCRHIANVGQYDFDQDGIGDACDNRPDFDCLQGLTCAEFVNCVSPTGCTNDNISCSTCGKSNTKDGSGEPGGECTESLDLLAGVTDCAKQALSCWRTAMGRIMDQGGLMDPMSTAGAKNRQILKDAMEECGLKKAIECALSAIPGFDCGSSISELVKSAKTLRKEKSLGAAGDVIGGGSTAAEECDEDASIFDNCKIFSVSTSFDPNYIYGPEGRGDTTIRWVPATQEMPFTIQFENDSTFATAAAQRVVVEQDLHTNIDPLSFQLRQVGFNNMIFDLPDMANYTGILDLDDSLNYDVQVTAGLDIPNLKVFCILQTINPQTGLPPNSSDGLLPVNDSLGSGQGFFSYTILPKTSTQTGDTATAKADIQFDLNPIIETNTWKNTFDAVKPVSFIDTLPPIVLSDSIELVLFANDDPGGSGIYAVRLYYQVDSGDFQYYGKYTNGDIVPFKGFEGSTYGFKTIAEDIAGNFENDKSNAQWTVQLGYADSVAVQQPGLFAEHCAQDSLFVKWTSYGIQNLKLRINNLSQTKVYLDTLIPASLLSMMLWINDYQDDTLQLTLTHAQKNYVFDTQFFVVNQPKFWYLDADNDQYYLGSSLYSCQQPLPGYVTGPIIAGGDCNDNAAQIHPGAVELCCNSIDENCNGLFDESNLHLKLFLQGFYTGNTQMAPALMNQGLPAGETICDTITVSLYDANLNLFGQAKTLLNTDGTALLGFQNINGSYYIVVEHRNTISTWSTSPVTFLYETWYDFTTSSTQAFGDNQVNVEGLIWAHYSGDINQDGVVDGLDYNDWETDNNNFGAGYLATDLNGDGIVDGLDFLLWEVNNNNFVGVITP